MTKDRFGGVRVQMDWRGLSQRFGVSHAARGVYSGSLRGLTSHSIP